jgi:hypothetical protein
VSVTADKGFFWIPMNREPPPQALAAIADSLGTGEYSKEGAILAGIGQLPADEDANPRQWCAKSVNLWARVYGLDLGHEHVPTATYRAAIPQAAAPLRFVRMDSTT